MLLTLTALRSIDGIHSGCFGHVVKHRPERYMMTFKPNSAVRAYWILGFLGYKEDVIYDLMTNLG